MRKRDEQLASFIGTNCPQVTMQTETGKRRKTLAADIRAIFRIIQSIPSPKAEPFKLWMAQVTKERLEQMQERVSLPVPAKISVSKNWSTPK